uniref:Uncharacterized protein n=1 Tax=Ditylenchus dipsaci TaxID=166011 RepID=A0A915EWV2_9BILA
MMEYNLIVDRHTPLDNALVYVLARDKDTLHTFGSIRYSWDKPNKLTEYFQLNPIDGVVTLKKLLKKNRGLKKSCESAQKMGRD